MLASLPRLLGRILLAIVDQLVAGLLFDRREHLGERHLLRRQRDRRGLRWPPWPRDLRPAGECATSRSRTASGIWSLSSGSSSRKRSVSAVVVPASSSSFFSAASRSAARSSFNCSTSRLISACKLAGRLPIERQLCLRRLAQRSASSKERAITAAQDSCTHAEIDPLQMRSHCTGAAAYMSASGLSGRKLDFQ